MSRAQLVSADQAYQDALAHLQAKEHEAWAKCLSDVTLIMAKAGKKAPGQPVTFFPRLGGAFYQTDMPVSGTVGCCWYLPGVMQHCAFSGWSVWVESPPWWRRWLGEPDSYVVQVRGVA